MTALSSQVNAEGFCNDWEFCGQLVMAVHKKTAVPVRLVIIKAIRSRHKGSEGHFSSFYVQQGDNSLFGWNVAHLSDRAFVADMWVTLKSASSWGR